MIPSEGATTATAHVRSRTIRGTVGHRGRVQGTVRVVNAQRDYHALNKGEIVVVDTLSPDSVRYLQGVGGIITNAGGILSHAALVARELHIPCVVGTKNATGLLRTGDIALLDANKGMVRVLGKS